MKKLSETMKYLIERKDFVKNEELKRKYQQESLETPVDENVYYFNNLISRDEFIKDKDLMEKYSKVENGTATGKFFNMKPLESDERCLSFSEYLKNGIL